MLETIQLRVRLVSLAEDVEKAHQMLDAFGIPRSSNTGTELSVTERLEFLREQLANAEVRQEAVLEAARAYRVSKEHYYRANDDKSAESHIQMAEKALLKAVNRLNRESVPKRKSAQ